MTAAHLGLLDAPEAENVRWTGHDIAARNQDERRT
jgi:hypothetical protein